MCGIFGIANHSDAARLTYLGLYALQHRGQESTGISASSDTGISTFKAMGHVADVYTEEGLKRLRGSSSIGHTRYSTAGDSSTDNAQPIVAKSAYGELALCHNGNLINAAALRQELEANGAVFQSTSDSEVILHLIARADAETLEEALVDALRQVQGAFCIVLLNEGAVIAARDGFGFRPLCIGRFNGAYAVASESCAFDLINASYLREVEPGEVVVIREGQFRSLRALPRLGSAKCIFEHVYFSRPDSIVFGRTVQSSRDRMGRILAEESGVEADLVVPVPDSGVTAAIGYSQRSGIPFQMGLIRNHYVGRTFIEPQQSIRHFGVKVKLNPVRELLLGKRVVLIDDSIVRGTTSRKIVKMVRAAGAREVHVRISCPPTISPCFYGIDTPNRRELIASSHTIEEIRKYIEADSLAYLSLPGLLRAVEGVESEYCTACYTGEYPLGLGSDMLDAKANDRQMDLWEEPDPEITELSVAFGTARSGGSASDDS
jgi:amidophosphoribosyltransferase